MNGLNVLFGVISIGCGLYCLYAYYLLKFKGEITESLLLPKGVDVKKCKDYRGYCAEAQKPVLMLAIATLIYGSVDLYCYYIGGANMVVMIMIAVVLVVLVVYSVWTRKINMKYFKL
ncbi:MAG: hypothetical protein ACI4S2_02035 [Lachnospiraceae bacterium]